MASSNRRGRNSIISACRTPIILTISHGRDAKRDRSLEDQSIALTRNDRRKKTASIPGYCDKGRTDDNHLPFWACHFFSRQTKESEKVRVQREESWSTFGASDFRSLRRRRSSRESRYVYRKKLNLRLSTWTKSAYIQRRINSVQRAGDDNSSREQTCNVNEE